jgi:hypothetical protein
VIDSHKEIIANLDSNTNDTYSYLRLYKAVTIDCGTGSAIGAIKNYGDGLYENIQRH